jgi:hypothetical protein
LKEIDVKSKKSNLTTKASSKEGGGDLINEEEKEDKQITLKDIRNFLSFSLGTCSLVIFGLLNSIAIGSLMVITYFISYWSQQEFEE